MKQGVIITGASSGIGEALARAYASRGACVMMAARNEARLEDIANVIKLAGGTAEYLATDVTKAEECRALIGHTMAHFGRIDILICNAGISMRALFDDVELEVLHRLMDVNFWGAVNCIKYALPHLQSSHGSIVGVNSVAGIHGLPARSGYSASKSAMIGFLETIRIENREHNLHVMVAYPGFTASSIRLTALTADGSNQGESPRNEEHMMSAERVAEIIIRDTAHRRRISLMEFNGWGSYILKRLAPSLLDRLFYNAMARESDSPLQRG